MFNLLVSWQIRAVNVNKCCFGDNRLTVTLFFRKSSKILTPCVYFASVTQSKQRYDAWESASKTFAHHAGQKNGPVGLFKRPKAPNGKQCQGQKCHLIKAFIRYKLGEATS